MFLFLFESFEFLLILKIVVVAVSLRLLDSLVFDSSISGITFFTYQQQSFQSEYWKTLINLKFSGSHRFNFPILVLCSMSLSIFSNSSKWFCRLAKNMLISVLVSNFINFIISFNSIFLRSTLLVKDSLSCFHIS